VIRFRDGGRYFQLQVAVGANATDATRADVVRALNFFAPAPDASCVQSAELRAPGAYHPSFSASSGAPGDTVTPSGYTPFPPRGEGGQYSSQQGSSAEVWWNDGADFQGAVPRQPGATTKLAGQDTSATCAYTIEFTVPQVTPGVYPVTVREVFAGGYSWYGEENFRVTG